MWTVVQADWSGVKFRARWLEAMGPDRKITGQRASREFEEKRQRSQDFTGYKVNILKIKQLFSGCIIFKLLPLTYPGSHRLDHDLQPLLTVSYQANSEQEAG